MPNDSCVFCKIIAGQIPAHKVHEDDISIVFLDIEPLFPGHCLIVPKEHYGNLLEFPANLLEPLFKNVQLIGRAVERGLGAEGSFIATNTKVSQSVPHLHVHVVPRRKKDGLRGFFWPKRLYRDESHMNETRDALRSAIAYLNSHA